MKSLNQSLFNFPGNALLAREVETHIAHQQESIAQLGAHYLADYITESDEQSYLRHIDNAEWLSDLKRRVQHYGYRYDYRDRKISKDMCIGDLPAWITPLAERLGRDFFDGRHPEQMIINEYEPGQGIAPHVDCEPCFGPTIVSISLGSACVMNLMRRATSADDVCRIADAESERIDLFLEPRSAIVLTGDSRYHWTHGIAPRKSDTVAGHKYPRTRRVSLTFRSVIL